MIELIRGKYKTISIVGMAKNSGKTVALNYLIEEAIENDVPLGITSIGRDGEILDIVTETEKPPIFVEEGTFIATASGILDLGDANIEILKATDYMTPLGQIIIGKVRQGGYVQIAGPQRLSEIRKVADTMLSLGAEFVIIDGALDRFSQAAPAVSEATILSTGAVISRDINIVIEKTLHRVKTLSLPKIEGEEIRESIRQIMERGQIATIDLENKIEIIPLKTALNSGHIIGDHIKDKVKYLVIPGSLVKSTLEDLIKSTRRYGDIEIIIGDGSKVFIEARDWVRFVRQGIKIRVLDEIKLIGITVNPYAPAGYYFDPRDFLAKMKSYIKHIPVMDLVLGGE